jgi:hypothetical protein
MRSCRIGLAVLIACAAPMWLGASAGTTSSKLGGNGKGSLTAATPLQFISANQRLTQKLFFKM